MGRLILAFFVRRWMTVAIVAGVLGVLGYVGTKSFFAGKHWVENRIEKTVVEMLKERDKVDEEISNTPDSAVRDQLRGWVLDEDTSATDGKDK